jgi:predicted ATPase/class 3 adenylate cyclase
MDTADLRHRLMAILAADVAGYSRLMADDERATIIALDAARDVFRRCVKSRSGRIVDTAGDSVLAVFDTAGGAVETALAIQTELQAASVGNPKNRQMRFRIGIHLGDVVEKPDGSVYGNGVNVAARLQTLAAPGGIWVSEAVRSTLGERTGCAFDDQGHHQIKNIAEPIHAYRLFSPTQAGSRDNGHDLSRTTDVAPEAARPVPNNLPLNSQELIGREEELAAVAKLLPTTHLLTVVGAGGVGKTRFALEIAGLLGDEYPDGAWFVELAPTADPALVPAAVADALGVHEEPGRPLRDTVLDALRRRRLLLVLDNCEHLIEACARFAERVLHACADVRTLATSREGLGIEGETIWRMPSLRTAAPTTDESIEQLSSYPAIRLFMQRAGAASPGFQLTAANAPSVIQICHRLDGIPLALELAAARVRAMRVEQVAERLQDRFRLLTRGSRTALLRHQTLRSLIDWSHELLEHAERVLLRRLSVFAGGWTLEAAEAVCAGDIILRDDVLDLLTRLVEKSLVVLDEQSADPRYRLLESIRQFAAEHLMAAEEAAIVRSRHLRHLVDFAESIRNELNRPEQLRFHSRVDAEIDNIRVALDWALEPGNAQLGLRLVNALHRYWYKTMNWKEVVERIEGLRVRSELDGPATPDHARALCMAGILASYADPPKGRRMAEDALIASRQLGFNEGIAQALGWLAYLDSRKRDPSTAAMFEESLTFGRRVADPYRRAMALTICLTCYAGYEALMGRDASAEAMVREAEIEIGKTGNDGLLIGRCRALLGTMAIRQGEFDRAETLLAESLAMYRAVDVKYEIAGGLEQQGFLALRRGDPERALRLFQESLPIHRAYPTSPWVTRGLALLLIAYAACARWRVAAQLAGVLGSADLGEEQTVAVPAELSGRIAKAYQDGVAESRAKLGDEEFRQQANAGRVMTREQAMELALARCGE